MFICAAGDIHGAMDRLYQDVSAFEALLGVRFDQVLHVGDFGIWPDPTRIDKATLHHEGAGDFPAWLKENRAAPRPTLFIKGNHEDFVWFLRYLDVPIHRAVRIDDGIRRVILYAFVRKEAVLSSQIEGTQATLVDLLNFEGGNEVATPDIDEVCNYVDALKYAREQLASARGLPLSMRLLNETHRLLMRGV